MSSQSIPLTKWQKTLIVLISKKCDIECIKIIMPHVDNLNFGVDQENPLISSVWSNEMIDTDLVKYLVSFGADPNTRSSQGTTPIHFLAQQGNLELVKWFAENGADIYAVGNSGSDLMYFAKQSKVPELSRFVHELIKPTKELIEENKKLKKQNDELFVELLKYKEVCAGQESLKRIFNEFIKYKEAFDDKESHNIVLYNTQIM